jgi:UDP-N-acetylmuramate dehydrogenase
MHIEKYVDLASQNTIQIGGKVEQVYYPKTLPELIEVLKTLRDKQIAYFVLGSGSNTVFADTIEKNQAIINVTKMDHLEIDVDHEYLYIQAGAGLLLQDIVDLAQFHHAIGVTGLNRIPGTLGGAVLGNAGAYGCEICNVIERVDIVDLDSGTFPSYAFSNFDCGFSYRSSFFKSKRVIITTIYIKLAIVSAKEFETEEQKYQEIAIKRDAVYPPELKSAGSLFKNIIFADLDEDVQQKIPTEWVMYGKLPAGRLLEAVGAKEFHIGDIHMRQSHANIIINDGNASFEQASELVQELQKRVKEKFGIDLEPEVRFVPRNFAEFRHYADIN